MKGSSSELQEICLQGLLSDPYLLSTCIPHIKDSFFENVQYRLIYNCIKKYYNKYSGLPNNKELCLLIKENYDEKYGDEEAIIASCNTIFSSINTINKDFVYERVTEFIRRNNIEKSLGNIIEYVKTGDIDLDKVAIELKDSLNINFSRNTIYTLSDVTKITEVREEALGPSDNPVIVKFFIDPVNWCMQYKGLIPGTVNMIVAPPGRGKTTTSINQGIYTAEQGYNVLHVFLGDMSRYDGLLRYLSCLSGVDTSKLVELSDEQLAAFIRKYNMTGVLGHISIASYAADEKTPNQLIEEIIHMQRETKTHYNVIIIDYDENFAKETDSMYESGGNVYNRIALFAVLNKSVVFILAQPKPAFWDKEIIPLEAAAESSKKQKIIDLMLTIGKPSKESSVGTLNIAKNRRGDDSKYVRLKFTGSNARIQAITDKEYIETKSKEAFNNKNIDKDQQNEQ